jgi:multidrug efflux pump subunit AcrA (membrane-fusion protein)
MFESHEIAKTISESKTKFLWLTMAIAYVALSLVLLLEVRGRINSLETAQMTTNSTLHDLAQRSDAEESTMQARTNALAEQLGMTQKTLQRRTAQLRREQHASVSQLQKEQSAQIENVRKEQKEQIDGVKTDIAATNTDLASTKQRLDRTIGDLGAQSGLIAHTREDLELLKHRGDRNYYEFTLTKGRTTHVSTVSLQLRKANPKRGKFTLNVLADDRTIEKKDRTMYEPLQFYTGRNRQLYEVVVFTMNKNTVSGYMSAPKYREQDIAQGQ